MAIENGAGVLPARSAPFERFAGAIFAAGFLCAVAYSEEAIAATISYRECVHAHHQPGIELARESIRIRPTSRVGAGGCILADLGERCGEPIGHDNLAETGKDRAETGGPEVWGGRANRPAGASAGGDVDGGAEGESGV